MYVYLTCHFDNISKRIRYGSSITVDQIDDLPLDNLQNTMGAIYGKAQYAATTAGDAKGQAQWAANGIGFLDYHLRQIADIVGYTVPPMPS